MKILFIHEVSYREKVIFEMHEFPELFSIMGDDVTFFEFPEQLREKRFSLTSKTSVIHGRVYPEAKIRLVTPPFIGAGPINRIIAPIVDLPVLWKLIKHQQFDRIVLYSVPTTGWQTVAIAKKFNTPVIFRALDVSHKIRKTIFWPLVLLAEKYIYKNATLVSGNNPAMVRYCVSISGRESISRVNVPPLDLEHFASKTKLNFRDRYQISKETKVLLYMGTFFTFSGLEVVIEEFAQLTKEHPDVVLLLIGGGEQENKLKQLVSDLQLEKQVIFTGFVGFDDLPSALQAGDVAINAFKPELVTHVALPNKILQYMAAGIPVVSTSLDGIREILGENSGVTWVPAPQGLVTKAFEVANYPKPDLESIIHLQKQSIHSKFDKSVALNSFRSTVETLT